MMSSAGIVSRSIVVMNPLVQLALNTILPYLEEAIKLEGPVALEWIETEVEKIAAKYAIPTKKS